MKTISAEPGMMMRFNEGRSAESVLTKRAVPTWLPAPAVREQSAAKTRALKLNKPAKSIWIPLESDSLGQKLVGAVLVVVALTSIGYGFASLIDLVQNWAAVNSTIGQIL